MEISKDQESRWNEDRVAVKNKLRQGEEMENENRVAVRNKMRNRWELADT